MSEEKKKPVKKKIEGAEEPKRAVKKKAAPKEEAVVHHHAPAETKPKEETVVHHHAEKPAETHTHAEKPAEHHAPAEAKPAAHHVVHHKVKKPKHPAHKENYGTGRRKRATARVWLNHGTGKISVNKHPAEEFFCNRPVLLRVLIISRSLSPKPRVSSMSRRSLRAEGWRRRPTRSGWRSPARW